MKKPLLCIKIKPKILFPILPIFRKFLSIKRNIKEFLKNLYLFTFFLGTFLFGIEGAALVGILINILMACWTIKEDAEAEKKRNIEEKTEEVVKVIEKGEGEEKKEADSEENKKIETDGERWLRKRTCI